MELTDEQRDKIMRDIGEGFTSGRMEDDNGVVCSWDIKIDIWKR